MLKIFLLAFALGILVAMGAGFDGFVITFFAVMFFGILIDIRQSLINIEKVFNAKNISQS